MKITQKHIKLKKTIGYMNNLPIDLVVTFGGFNVLFLSNKNKTEILGAGSHKEIAKYMADKKYNNIKWIDDGN